MYQRILRGIAYALASFLLLGGATANGQGIVRGFIYDKDNGEPMLFVNVVLQNTTLGAATDVHGYFAINKVPAGDYEVIAFSIGYDTVSNSIVVADNEIVTVKMYMKESAISLQQVEISAGKQEQRTEVQMSVSKITPREISQVPAAGGEPDLAQYMQVLPGVVFTGDQGGQLYIRGGTPIQNKVLLDGMVVYNPFHSIGLFSVFDSDIIKTADVYTGGFNAEYGGRISSVMDVTTRDGNKNRFNGKFSASTFNSKLTLEGPFKKPKENGGSSGTYIFSGRTSYLDQTSKSIYKYVDDEGLPYRFLDFYGKGTLTGSNGSKFSLFGFRFDDNVNYEGISEYQWNSFGAGSNFVMVPGASPVLLDGTFAFTRYEIELQEADEQPRSSAVNGFNFTLNFSYFLGRDEVKYGLEGLGFKTDFTFFNSVGKKLEQVENTSEFAAFLKYKRAADKVVIEPSLRVHYYASLNEFSFEPRAGLKLNLSERLRFKAAAGLYAQNLLAAVSDRDVVNLFYGFLSGPDNLQDEFRGEEVTSRLQHAAHLVAGVEVDLFRNVSVNLEGYIKDFNQVENVNRNKIFEDTGANFDKPDSQKKDIIVEKGLARGADIAINYESKKWYIWLVYSLGFVTRDDGITEYEPHFDRRHNVNAVVSYTFGDKMDWVASARWNFGSGFPFTLTAGFYEYLDFQQGINVDYTNSNGDLGVIYDELNKGRLPYYHRMDMSIKKTFTFSERSELAVIASVTNVYDRDNIFYFDRIRGERVDQLPILPSLGASITF